MANLAPVGSLGQNVASINPRNQSQLREGGVMQQVALDTGRRQRIASHEASRSLVVCEALEFETSDAPEFIDITDFVAAIVADSGIAFGQVTIFSTHTTAAIKINENEPLLLRDMARTLRQVAPTNAYYEHNDFSRRTVNMNEDECANGHSHCQHLFLGTSECVPVIEGRMALGQWQRIFLVELDHPRQRRVLVNVVGAAATEG